jgi:hypothetical protein
MMDSKLVSFYRGVGRDDRGRSLTDVQRQSQHDLEKVHDYIQWMFPLPEPSAANPGAPVLTASDIEEFNTNADLNSALRTSFSVMLTFYGLTLTEEAGRMRVVPGLQFQERSRAWLRPGNHNFLRITRILRCLNTLGCQHEAAAFFGWLKELYDRNSALIGHTTLGHWEEANRMGHG